MPGGGGAEHYSGAVCTENVGAGQLGNIAPPAHGARLQKYENPDGSLRTEPHTAGMA